MFCLHNLCFLCLAHNKQFTTLSSINPNAEDMLERIIPEFLLQTSGMPRKLCDDCIGSLTTVFEFRRKCLENIIIFDKYVKKLQECGSYKNLAVTIADIKLDIKKEIDKEVILGEDTCNLENDLRTDCLQIEDAKHENASYRESNEELYENDHKNDVVLDIKKEIDEEIILDENISFLEYNVRTNFFELDDIKQEHSYNKDSNEEQDENDQTSDVALDIKKEINEEIILDENISFHEDNVCTNFFQIDGDIKQKHSYNRESNEEQYEDDKKKSDVSFEIKKEISEEIMLDENICFLEYNVRTKFLEIDEFMLEHSYGKDPNEEQYENDQKNDVALDIKKEINEEVIIKEDTNFLEDNLTCQTTHYFSDTGKSNEPEPSKCTQCGKEFFNRIRDIVSLKCQQCQSIRNESKQIHKLYACNTCPKSFSSISELKEHEPVHTGKSPYCCDICGKRYSRIQSMKLHRLLHTNEKPFACDICQKGFATRYKLRTHKISHNYRRSFECYICKKSFISPEDLKQHQILHTGPRKFKCEVCGNKYFRKSTLTQHERTHTDQPYQCELCEKKFIFSSVLKRHMISHGLGSQFECSICKKRLKCADSLRLHKSLHLGEKPFKCNICEKTFISSPVLKKHKNIHNYKRRYSCTICNQSFNYLSHLERHKRSHTGQKPFSCDVCPKKFSQVWNLRTHKRYHDGIRDFECGICRKSFYTSSDRNKHERNLHKENSETAQE